MWDGSAVPLEENLQIAQELLAQAAEAKIVLEVEIGVVGGEEDGVEGGGGEQLYSTTDDALATVEALGTGEKGRYLTALTFGNVHGVYKPGNVKLRPEILKKAQDAVVEKLGLEAGSKPFDLVFHGGSGSTAEEIAAAVEYGVIKMNVDTDTQYAFTRPVAGHMFEQLRRRAQDRRRGRQQEGLRPARVGQGRRGRHGDPRRRGLRQPEQHRPLDRLTLGFRCNAELLPLNKVHSAHSATRTPRYSRAGQSSTGRPLAGQSTGRRTTLACLVRGVQDGACHATSTSCPGRTSERPRDAAPSHRCRPHRT